MIDLNIEFNAFCEKWTNWHKNYCDSRVTFVTENQIFGVKIQNKSSFLTLIGLPGAFFVPGMIF